jgi:PAS domain S-box-containing protein
MSLSEDRQLADFKRALDHAAIVAITDVHGRITYANDKFCEISGYSRDELLGQDHRIINSGYHSKEFMKHLWHTIANGRVWHGEIRNRAKDSHFYWVDTTIVPFLDDRGKPYQYIAIRADITARKAAEDTLVQQAALAQVGQMAAVVAHEVRNPLAGIKGVMQVLIARRPDGDADVPVMNDIVARIDSLGELVNDLMLFARPRAPRPVELRLQPIVAEAITLVRRDPAAASVQIVGERGTIQVRTTVSTETVVVEIRDNGPGIPAALQERVLEPFFTTKARGGGLGLPIAKRSAELHGGSLTLSSPAGGGAVATLTLPLPAARPVAPVRTSRSDSAPGRG